MKANEFVKVFGWDWAKEILKESYNCGLYVDANINVTCHQMVNEPEEYKDGGYFFHRDDLKRLIESHELVEKWQGLEASKIKVNLLRTFGFHTQAGQLQQAIADVESCQ